MHEYDFSADFGLLYDSVPLYEARRDVELYVGEVERMGKGATVLEVGCGSGRITLPIARAGHVITGVDASRSMLERFRAKLAVEPADVRQRVTVMAGDAAALALPAEARFDVAIAPFRVIQHLVEVPDQLAFLRQVRAHLAPAGRLVFDVFNPKYSAMLSDRSAEKEDTPELALPDGRFMRRASRVTAVHWQAQVSDVEMIYYVREAGKKPERIVQRFPMRWYTRVELEHLLARAGFHIRDLFGSVDRQPLADDSSEILVVAEPMAAGSKGDDR